MGRWRAPDAAALLACLLALLAHARGDDVRCLRGVRDALSDPEGRLSETWNFSNATVGFVCSFVGVSCWNPQENRVLGLSLPSMSLGGVLPSALQYCTSLNTLDLSANAISGPLPSGLCDWLPFIVNLILSDNHLSGPLPPDLSGCRYLNKLLLDNNSLSGPIPPSLARLDRLRTLSLADNRLSGQIPADLATFDSSSFDGNSLCGRPLSSCGHHSLSRTSLIIILAAGVFGAAASLLLAYAAWRWCFSPAARKRPAPAGLERAEGARSWADRLRSSQHRLVPVSLFQKPIVKVKLADLMAATADFRPDRIVAAGSARTGTSYGAVLRDGSALTVKRLHGCKLPEKQFRSEMGRLGQLRHPNLVPLLGFCIVEDERLLIYKQMPSGALSTLLPGLSWPARLRIGIGAARGLAWLHHGSPAPVLHQSITSSAILLDEDYEPRITEFGVVSLVRASGSADDEASPFMNGDFGEFGYIPPEYATNPVATAKGDVYSFGVVLLEIVTGQKPTEVSSDAAGEGFKGNLVDWVNQLSSAGRVGDAIDKSLCGKGHEHEIMQFLAIACACVMARPKERPSMYKVYQSLKDVGEGYDFLEEFDEFPLNFGKDDAGAL